MKPLPEHLIGDASVDELACFNENVGLGGAAEEAKADSEGKILSGRFAMCNKRDNEVPDCRVRRAYIWGHCMLFAAALPLEAKRRWISMIASRQGQDGAPLKLQVADAQDAYFNGRPQRRLYLRLPRELSLPIQRSGPARALPLWHAWCRLSLGSLFFFFFLRGSTCEHGV